MVCYGISGVVNYTFYRGNVVCVPVHVYFFFTAAHFHLAGR